MNIKVMNIDRETSTKLKGFAVLFVLLSHINFILPLNDVISGIFSALCYAGMSGFLFLSGYGLYKSYSSGGGN